MKLIRTEKSVGHVLCHDLTQIIPNIKKDAVFRKGHIIKEEDIPILLSMGKENLYVWEKEENMLHENEAAQILYKICENKYMYASEIKEGKIEVISNIDGVFHVNIEKLNKINSLKDIIISTRHNNFTVKKHDKIAGMRVIPLLIEKEKIEKANKVAGNSPILSIYPFVHKKVGIITTGSEVFKGRIKDSFGPVIYEKLKEFDVEIIGQKIIDDDENKISLAINDYIEKGCQLIICTGGMSVDPDDVTPSGIKKSGADIISYGAPVLPGAMFLLSYINNNIPVIGLPGCVMYSKRTIFDLIIPRIMSDEILKKEDIDILGHGGFCLSCNVCTFPNCSFGK